MELLYTSVGIIVVVHVHSATVLEFVFVVIMIPGTKDL